LEGPTAVNSCPEPAILQALRAGHIEGPLAWRVRQHIRKCKRCLAEQARVETSKPHLRGGDATTPDALQRGAIIGRYVVIDQVGSGGMGVVYAAFDPELDRKVAIKLLVSDSPEGQAWILREAQAMARLSHPNVICVFDVGTLHERVFVAMEFVEGKTLRDWFYPRKPCAEVLEIFTAAGRGLAAAHSAGVVHRDFKPDNVLVGDDGRVRVMDFGLARGASETLSEPTPPDDSDAPVTLTTPLTRADVLVGTPIYMAPEQMDGTPADARTDQFSFAVSLYEALYGEMPFDGDPDDRPSETRWDVRPAPKGGPKVPSRVRRVVLRALSTDPSDRYSSVSALLNDLTQTPGPSRMPFVWAASVFAATGVVFAGSRLFARTPRELCRGPSGTLEICAPGATAGGLSPRDAAEVASLQRQLQEADALFTAGKPDEAAARVDPIVTAAQALRYRPLEAQALLAEGRFYLKSNPARSEAALEKAVWAAESTWEDDVALRAGTALVELARASGKDERAEFWEKYLGAISERSRPRDVH
jgi:hypothetical protein